MGGLRPGDQESILVIVASKDADKPPYEHTQTPTLNPVFLAFVTRPQYSYLSDKVSPCRALIGAVNFGVLPLRDSDKSARLLPRFRSVMYYYYGTCLPGRHGKGSW
jgi:hypothetical protein